MKRFTFFAIIFFSFGMISESAIAQLVVIKKPRHKKIVVVKPAHHAKNMAWIGGHWTVGGSKKYVWVDGYWTRKRPGAIWIEGHWKKVRGGWMWVPGHWYRSR